MAAVESAVEGEVARLEAVPQPVDRTLASRRPIAFVAWLGIGCIGTYVDKIHERLGVVAYPDPTWIGERLPVSPIYLAATLGFFVLYVRLVGINEGPQGILGGVPLRWVEALYAHASWVVAYGVSGTLGASSNIQEDLPALACAILIAWAAPTLWRERNSRLPAFALAVVIIGTGFEWWATSRGMFTYPVCPSRACFGATVPLLWLPALYLHAAIYVHRMLGGARLLETSTSR